MQLWGVALIVLAAGGFLFYRYFLRRLDWRIKLLAFRLARLVNCASGKGSRRFMKDLYLYINLAIHTGNQAAAYQAIDLLKLALGERLGRDGEAMRLMALTVAALRAKQPDIAGYILDAYKPLLRNIAGAGQVAAIEQLTLIAMVSFKARYPFMLGKAADNIFLIAEQPERSFDSTVVIAGLHGLKIIGSMSLRRRDEALFREISTRAAELSGGREEISREVMGVWSEWLHRMIKAGDKTMLPLLFQICAVYWEKYPGNTGSFQILINEWQALAGTAALNPRSDLAAEVLDFLFSMAEKRADKDIWNFLVSKSANTAKIAVAQHGMETSFPTIYPLFDAGRRLLSAELRFSCSTDELRRTVLFMIIKECVMLAALIARTDMTHSAGEIIAKFYDCWSNYPHKRGSAKSVKKFCQILLLYWIKGRQHQARYRLPANEAVMIPVLVTEAEKSQLSL